MECVKRDIFSEHLLCIRHRLPWKWVTAVLWLISQCRPGLTWTEGRHRVQCKKPLPRIVQNWPLMQGSTFHLGCSCFQQDLMPQRDITLKESAQRLQQFHSKKASLKVKLSQPLPQGLSPEHLLHLSETSGLLKKTAGRSHPDQEGPSCWITGKWKEGSKGRKEWTHILKGKKEEGGQSLLISVILHLVC